MIYPTNRYNEVVEKPIPLQNKKNTFLKKLLFPKKFQLFQNGFLLRCANYSAAFFNFFDIKREWEEKQDQYEAAQRHDYELIPMLTLEASEEGKIFLIEQTNEEPGTEMNEGILNKWPIKKIDDLKLDLQVSYYIQESSFFENEVSTLVQNLIFVINDNPAVLLIHLYLYTYTYILYIYVREREEYFNISKHERPIISIFRELSYQVVVEALDGQNKIVASSSILNVLASTFEAQKHLCFSSRITVRGYGKSNSNIELQDIASVGIDPYSGWTIDRNEKCTVHSPRIDFSSYAGVIKQDAEIIRSLIIRDYKMARAEVSQTCVYFAGKLTSESDIIIIKNPLGVKFIMGLTMLIVIGIYFFWRKMNLNQRDADAVYFLFCRQLRNSFSAFTSHKSADAQSKHICGNDHNDEYIEITSDVIDKASLAAQIMEHKTAQEFVKEVLEEFGYPSLVTEQYLKFLEDNCLTTMKQLKEMNRKDWKRLAYPDDIITRLLKPPKNLTKGLDTSNKTLSQMKKALLNLMTFEILFNYKIYVYVQQLFFCLHFFNFQILFLYLGYIFTLF
ncbi:hypothetical protein RFI_09925 [Reticulomyxa filosa]|uniref:Uncharacterized protein n=1 Tax=Reticulomyxa filosa TaxID=46433 RepID=X6NPA9_RETFI|nr:hypothetical protein RFI_09925 [Reticulomyxa filosa]|eukprot:ETO27207.1 hypothetical protein RFI_09925 [Reticulomyxa filosa]